MFPFRPRENRPLGLGNELITSGRCSAVSQSTGLHCGEPAMWHYLCRRDRGWLGGMPGCHTDDVTVAMCNEHNQAFHENITWWTDRHEFSAHGGPCGLPGTVWTRDRCDLDVATARDLVAVEFAPTDVDAEFERMVAGW